MNIPRREINLWYAVIILVGALVFLAVGEGIYFEHRLSDNNKKWCKTLNIIIRPGPDAPSPTPGTRGYEIAKSLRELRDSYQCQ